MNPSATNSPQPGTASGVQPGALRTECAARFPGSTGWQPAVSPVGNRPIVRIKKLALSTESAFTCHRRNGQFSSSRDHRINHPRYRRLPVRTTPGANPCVNNLPLSLLGAWILKFHWMLELGIWSFQCPPPGNFAGGRFTFCRRSSMGMPANAIIPKI